MTIIDAQLHEPALSRDHQDLDRDALFGLMVDVELAYMDAVGVDKAVLFPIDHEWGPWACAAMPERFTYVPMLRPPGVLGGLDVTDPGLAEQLARWAEDPACVAVRMMHTLPGHLFEADAAGPWVSDVDVYEPLLEGAVAHGLPVFISTAGGLDGPAEILRRHPELVLIVDHLGLRQNPTFGLESPPMRDLPRLLALAEHPTAHVKVSGVPTLSGERYPFADLWDGLEQVVDAFGAERLMWGSDISRVMGRAGSVRLAPPGLEYPRHTYAEALHYIRETDRLTATQKEWLLGRTAATVLGWN